MSSARIYIYIYISILGQILFILYINYIHKCLDISDDKL